MRSASRAGLAVCIHGFVDGLREARILRSGGSAAEVPFLPVGGG